MIFPSLTSSLTFSSFCHSFCICSYASDFCITLKIYLLMSICLSNCRCNSFCSYFCMPTISLSLSIYCYVSICRSIGLSIHLFVYVSHEIEFALSNNHIRAEARMQLIWMYRWEREIANWIFSFTTSVFLQSNHILTRLIWQSGLKRLIEFRYYCLNKYLLKTIL